MVENRRGGRFLFSTKTFPINHPLHLYHKCLIQACCAAPHHFFSLSPKLASPLFPLPCNFFCLGAVLCAVHDTYSVHIHTGVLCVMVAVGGSRLRSVSGALVMCWWYSLWGMFPSVELWIHAVGFEHKCTVCLKDPYDPIGFVHSCESSEIGLFRFWLWLSAAGSRNLECILIICTLICI